jgi:hypothetical protein
MQEAAFICGHNIVQFDIPILQQDEYLRLFSHIPEAIETLLLSPLLFPEQPYHSLIVLCQLEFPEIIMLKSGKYHGKFPAFITTFMVTVFLCFHLLLQSLVIHTGPVVVVLDQLSHLFVYILFTVSMRKRLLPQLSQEQNL